MEQLTEWRPHRLTLEPGERRELLRLIKRGAGPGEVKIVEALQPTDDEGIFDLVPGPYVGRFGLRSGRVFDIASRLILPGELTEVLRIAGRLPARLDDAATPAGEGWGVVDSIALALAAEAERIIGHGISKAYRPFRFRTPPFPGTIDFREHLGRYAGRADKLVTVARRLSVNIDRNQAIATATARLLELPLQPLARRQLRRVRAALGAVSVTALSPDAVEQLVGSPRQARYDLALRLAAVVLGGGTVTTSGLGLAGASVLFSMPKVWEDFVLAWARRRHPGAQVLAQYDFPLLTDRRQPVVFADVVVLDEFGKPKALYDAKYKALGQTPSADDIYQLVTYCQRLGLTEATLVYPGRGAAAEVTVGDVRLNVVRLSTDDVEGDGLGRSA